MPEDTSLSLRVASNIIGWVSLIQLQKGPTGPGLASGARGQRLIRVTGGAIAEPPVKSAPTLAEAGIDRKLSARRPTWEIRQRAIYRLEELRKAQSTEGPGLAKGGQPYQTKSTELLKGQPYQTKSTGVLETPVEHVPTLAQAGIDKNLAKQMRSIGKLSRDEFEEAVQEGRQKIEKAADWEIRQRAECRLGELIQLQKETVELAKGGQPLGYRFRVGTVRNKNHPPTLAEPGIDKTRPAQSSIKRDPRYEQR